jgi:P27 family predicted phage terminase small subunit
MPHWLVAAPEAARCWRYLSRKLAAQGTLAKIDRIVFERYCYLYSQWRAAAEWILKFGPRLPTKDLLGNVTGYTDAPEVGRLLRLSGELERLERKLGLSAADRAGLAIAVAPAGKPQSHEDELAAKYGG